MISDFLSFTPNLSVGVVEVEKKGFCLKGFPCRTSYFYHIKQDMFA